MPPRKPPSTPTLPTKRPLKSVLSGKISKKPRRGPNCVTEEELPNSMDPKLLAAIKVLLADNTLVVTTKMDQCFDKLSERLVAQDTKIQNLQSEVDSLKNTVEIVSSENNLLWVEVNKLNLVFQGITDNENESDEELNITISNLLRELTGENCPFDTAKRQGKFNATNRIVKVRFLSIQQRDEVFSKRFITKYPVFINEDLPAAVRRDHAKMRQQKKALIADGYSAKMVRVDWKRKIIRTPDMVFKFKDGLIADQYPITSTKNLDKSCQPTTHRFIDNNKFPSGQISQMRGGFHRPKIFSNSVHNHNHAFNRARGRGYGSSVNSFSLSRPHSASVSTYSKQTTGPADFLDLRNQKKPLL